eukprot:TRINITY_DN1257_c0_g1_i1.p1 TRINITY_DN1257_c0_g1~~TRINITY_DN1257_c0_g1_i1.p1  ORF type:complete len:598 (-),score=47.37 TRINITY_DN1257_c0_g1_i1:905-2698(-)
MMQLCSFKNFAQRTYDIKKVCSTRRIGQRIRNIRKIQAVAVTDKSTVSISSNTETLIGVKEEQSKDNANVWSLFALSVCYLHHSVTGFVIPAILPYVSRDLQLNDVQGGALTLGYTLLYAIALTPAGLLVDKLPRPQLLAVGSASWSILTQFAAKAHNFQELLLCRVGFACAQAVQNPICFTLIPELFPKNRATAMALYNSAIYLGRSLSFTVALICSQVGIQNPFQVQMVPMDSLDVSTMSKSFITIKSISQGSLITMVPVIPTDLPNSSVHQISINTLTTLKAEVTDIFSAITTQLQLQTEKTQNINKRIQEIDEKLAKIIESETEFTYQCPSGYPTEDEGWDFKPLFRQDLNPRKQIEPEHVDLGELGEWDKNNNLDSADLYNFYLGTQLETIDRRTSTVRLRSPKVYNSLNSAIELRTCSSEYFKVVEPVEVLNNIYEDAIASQQMSEKQSVGISTNLTQSSLISSNSQSRSQVLKRRRDNRRKNTSRQSPVSSLLRGTYNRSRQNVTPVSSRSPQNEIGIEEESSLGILDSSIVQNSFTEGMCRSPSWKLFTSGSGGSGSNGKEQMTLTGRSKSLNKNQIIISPKKQQLYTN